MTMSTRGRRLLWVMLAAPLVGCATAGSTFRSGVGDTFLEHPPYYAGADAPSVRSDTTAIGHVPVVFQRRQADGSVFDPRDGAGTAMGAFISELNAALDSIGVQRRNGGTPLSVRLVEGGKVSAVSHAETRTPPDVQFGCVTSNGVPGGECASDDGARGRGAERMRLAVGRPAATWVQWMRDVTDATGVQRVLVVTVEVSDFLPRQRGMLGQKIIELGTGNVASLPWLTSLETPVSVVQLTGALVDRDGRALRIGAEGLLPKRTRLLVSAVGGQELVGDDDITRLRTMRRDDLPGKPLAWRVALEALVSQLTGVAMADVRTN